MLTTIRFLVNKYYDNYTNLKTCYLQKFKITFELILNKATFLGNGVINMVWEDESIRFN